MTQIALPFGYWSVADPRASGRSTVNCFSEATPAVSSQVLPPAQADAKQTAYLRRAPGTIAFANDGTTNACRGAWEMAGVLYVVIGPTLYSVSSSGALTQIATGIGGGNGFVRMTDNTACLVILLPGTTIAYTYCPNGGGFAKLIAAGFVQYGAVDAWFCDTYICFLSLDGRTMFNDDGQAVSGQNQITFSTAAVFPRELGTDPLVGMAVDHRQVIMFGRRTTEAVGNVGNAVGSPFASTANTYMPIGMHPQAGYTAALQDQSVFWLANDRTVRRRNGQTPIRVSNSAVESLLSDANLTGCYAFTYSLGGHLMYVLTVPAAQLTLALDLTTGEWHEMSSLIGGSWSYWHPLCSINAFGNQLVGDSQSGQLGVLDFATFTEYGQPMTATFRTQSIYEGHNRIVHRRLEAVITPGESTSFTAGANLTCRISDDSGRTWRALPMRSLGALGQYSARAAWFNLGQSRDRVYEFSISDPTPLFAVDLLAELQGGRW